MRRAALLCCLMFPLLSPRAQAQTAWAQIFSGTGFFIDREGHLVTNAHVVADCRSISIRVGGQDRPVALIARDEQRDLAVLRMQGAPPAIAPLRGNIDALRAGDTLYLYGFPGRAGADGTPQFMRTRLIEVEEIERSPNWLHLRSVTEQGSSGGPVLDSSGNVIGVVMGYVLSKPKDDGAPHATPPKRLADIAITLAALEDFLRAQQIGLYYAASGLVAHAEPVIAHNAARFVVPVRCLRAIEGQANPS